MNCRMMAAQSKSFTRILKGLVEFSLVFETRTGLLIRMPLQAQAYRIGGADQYPMVTKIRRKGVELEVPYVPGSSFKGRMRSLLELAFGKKLYSTDEKIWQHARTIQKAMPISDLIEDVEKRCVIDDLFGYPAFNYEQLRDRIKSEDPDRLNDIDKIFNLLTPTRLLVDDFFPTDDTITKLNARSIADFLEEKSENRIDRITSSADPRDVVRVKPGVEFQGKATVLVFDNDVGMIKNYITTFATGLGLIELTYLGGSGSRGYGRVEFKKIEVKALKIVVGNSGPRITEAGVRRTYSSVKELEKDLENLVKEIEKGVFT